MDTYGFYKASRKGCNLNRAALFVTDTYGEILVLTTCMYCSSRRLPCKKEGILNVIFICTALSSIVKCSCINADGILCAVNVLYDDCRDLCFEETLDIVHAAFSSTILHMHQ